MNKLYQLPKQQEGSYLFEFPTLSYQGFLAGKKPSHGPGVFPGAFPFRLPCIFFLGLFSPVARAMVRTSALSPKASVGREQTGSRHVGHVKVGFGGMY